MSELCTFVYTCCK